MKVGLIYLALFIFILSGCGTTQLLVNHAGVDIYVNNVRKGKDIVKITRAGAPQRKTITAKYNGKTVGEVHIKREIDIVTVAVGLYTYGLGFIFCWRYPSMVSIPVNITENYPSDNQSIWKKPPRFWK